MAGFRKALPGLTAGVAGAFLVLVYLHFTLSPKVQEVDNLLEGAEFLLLFLGFAASNAATDDKRPDYDIAPAWSGAMVVIATGLASAIYLGWGAKSFTDLALPLFVALATVMVAVLVFRFAKKNADQIGEAKFRSR